VYGNKGVIQFSAMAGMAVTTLSFDDPNPGYYPGLSDDKFGSSLSPAFGVCVDFVPKKRQKNMFFLWSYCIIAIHQRPIRFITIRIQPVSGPLNSPC
jgi:hypothetical protein